MGDPAALRTITVTACCHGCHTEGLVRAGFDPTEPYVIYANLRSLPAKARREFVDALIANAESEVALYVSAPVPPEFRRADSGETDETAGVPVDPENPPTAEELDALLGTARDEGAH